MKAYLLIMNSMNVVDMASTLLVTSKLGWECELNPLARWAVQHVGVWPTSAFKIVAGFMLFEILWLVAKEARLTWVAWLLALVLTFVASFNVGIVIALY